MEASLSLQPYDPVLFPLLQSWITDKYLLLQYSGTHFRFPLTQEQLDHYATEFPERKMYFGMLNDTPVAFGEIIPQDSGSVRLARLLIGDPTLRGHGIGLSFVNALIAEAKERFNNPRIDLFVFSGNKPAISCYTKAGFIFMPEENIIATFEGQEYVSCKMKLAGT
jgi:RimJ/RimL family protein N-acetyltransferase